MWGCCRLLARFICILDILVYLGCICLLILFCIVGFGFRSSYACTDYMEIYWPIAVFVGVIKLWAFYELWTSCNKKRVTLKPKSAFFRIRIYFVVCSPILLLELAFGLLSLGTQWYAFLPFIILMSLAGKNLLFLLILYPTYSSLEKTVRPPALEETSNENGSEEREKPPPTPKESVKVFKLRDIGHANTRFSISSNWSASTY